jgi:hypothetical protein
MRDRLTRLAEPHVVGQDGPTTAEQESNAFERRCRIVQLTIELVNTL